MSFDWLAPYYRLMESVLAGGKLQRCRLAWLPEARSAKRALLAGEGHGRFLAECATQMPQTHFTCLDASRAMLAQAQRAWREAGGRPEKVSFVHATLPEWSPPEASFDLIVTHFFLDCFPPAELASVIATLTRAARPDAVWLVADFRVPHSGWVRLRAKLILASAYVFFKVATGLPASRLTPPDDLLLRHGFRLLGRRISEWGLLHADQWRLAEPIAARR